MMEAAKQVFGPSQPGFIIVLLVTLAVGSWLAEMITTAIGKGQITTMIKTGTQIASILIVVALAWKLLNIFYNFTQGKM